MAIRFGLGQTIPPVTAGQKPPVSLHKFFQSFGTIGPNHQEAFLYEQAVGI